MSGVRGTRRRRPELSQHFLKRGATAARIVGATTIARSDLVVEIGPGRGALTRPLVQRAGRVVAIELDGALCMRLEAEFRDGVEIVKGDFLDHRLPEGPYKVLSNLPYRHTSAMVKKLVDAENPPSDAWLIMQREPARRFVGPPYGPETAVSLRLKPAWHVEIVDRLKRGDFEPPPTVDSVVVWFARRGRTLLTEAERSLFEQMIASAYGRRITLRSALRPWLSKVQLRRLAAELGFDSTGEASRLRFDQWLAVTRFVERLW